MLLAGTPNLRRQLLADCCSRAWGMDVKTAFHCRFGHRLASYFPVPHSSVQFRDYLGRLNPQVRVVCFCWMDKSGIFSCDGFYASGQDTQVDQNISVCCSLYGSSLLGCAPVPTCIPPRRLYSVDGRDSLGFIFKRSPLVAGSYRIDPELTAMSTQHFFRSDQVRHASWCGMCLR